MFPDFEFKPTDLISTPAIEPDPVFSVLTFLSSLFLLDLIKLSTVVEPNADEDPSIQVLFSKPY